MQDELNWIPLGHRIGFLKHPDSEDYKCPVCGYEQYTIYTSPPKRCPKCHSEMANGVDFRKEMEALGIMIDEMNDIQMPYTDPAPGDLVRVVRKPINGYEGYYKVDQFGRVFSDDRIIHVTDNGREYDKFIPGKQMKQTMHSKGYKTVCLTKDGKTKQMYVHRLVAQAFIDNPDNLPFINHKDEDKTNNFADNLEWCTNEYNVNYGKGKEKRRKKIIGVPHTEEHKKKISESVKKYFETHKRYGERKDG